MDIRQLESFVEVANLASFTRASEALSLTQPAVTRQIAALEMELRTHLFDRLGRRVELTSGGRALYAYATEILRLSAEARTAVTEIAAGSTGQLAVGASSTAATYLLPPLLRRFREAHPAVELSVRTGPSRRIADMVIGNEVDLGIVMEDPAESSLTIIKLAEYANVAAVYPTHPLATHGRGAVDVASLAGEELIVMQAGTSMRASVDRLLADAAGSANVVMELDNVEAIKKMIEARFGISILPMVAISDEVAAGRLAAVQLTGSAAVTRPIAAIHRKDKYLTKSLKDLVALLRSELG
ncbi:MAG TPA: LysR family transcriptional regulator [Capsulimonadaceae bacterium]